VSGLLSVDFDEQFRKTLAHTMVFGEQYLIELVRSIVACGATTISVELRDGSAEVSWEGGDGLGRDLDALARLFREELPVELRETALGGFHKKRGLGLLAGWCCEPQSVEVESCDGAGVRRRLAWRGWRQGLDFEALASDGAALGNLRIRRRRRGSSEAAVLAEYCRFCPVPVRVNGALVSISGTPPEGLMGLKLSGDDGGPTGQVWVPRRGDVCRLVLTQAGIRWKVVATPTHRKGLVYEGAIEADAMSKQTMALLDSAAARLYRRMADALGESRGADRERAQHLLLHHARVSSQTKHIERSPLFPTYPEGWASLAEVRRWGQEGVAVLVRGGDRRGQVGAHGAGKRVLQLSDEQASFLKEQEIDLPTWRHSGGIGRGLSQWVLWAWRTVAGGREVARERWTSPEAALVESMEAALESGIVQLEGSSAYSGGSIVLLAGNGKPRLDLSGERPRLYLGRRSRAFTDACFYHGAGAPAALVASLLLEGECRIRRNLPQAQGEGESEFSDSPTVRV